MGMAAQLGPPSVAAYCCVGMSLMALDLMEGVHTEDYSWGDEVQEPEGLLEVIYQ